MEELVRAVGADLGLVSKLRQLQEHVAAHRGEVGGGLGRRHRRGVVAAQIPGLPHPAQVVGYHYLDGAGGQVPRHGETGPLVAAVRDFHDLTHARGEAPHVHAGRAGGRDCVLGIVVHVEVSLGGCDRLIPAHGPVHPGGQVIGLDDQLVGGGIDLEGHGGPVLAIVVPVSDEKALALVQPGIELGRVVGELQSDVLAESSGARVPGDRGATGAADLEGAQHLGRAGQIARKPQNLRRVEGRWRGQESPGQRDRHAPAECDRGRRCRRADHDRGRCILGV